MEVKQLVEQKRVVERELGELKAQLEKAGFSSLSQMRYFYFYIFLPQTGNQKALVQTDTCICTFTSSRGQQDMCNDLLSVLKESFVQPASRERRFEASGD